MQTNEELKAIVEEYSQKLKRGELSPMELGDHLRSKIFKDDDMIWAIRKIQMRHQKLLDLEQHHKAGRSKLFLGSVLLILAVLISIFYRPELSQKLQPVIYGAPYLIGFTLIWNGRNDMARY